MWTGNVDALPHAIRCAGYEGSVTVLSFYQRGAASLELGKEFHHKRITLRSSQVGGFNPDLRHQYNCQRRQEQSIWLAQNLELLPLISHRVPFEELPEALRVIDANPSACQSIVITYT
jgi:threonine dehydrogenase-like Zn-dependent dehydrogenase